MTVLLCFLLPPIFLMYVREKILGNKIKCNFYGNAKDFFREYFLWLCFLNFVVLAITYKIFHHDSSLDVSLMESAKFAFHYLLLSLTISVLMPIVENLFRFHFKIEISKFKIHINWNLVLYVFAIVLFLINFIRIFDNSFWGDEGFSIHLSQMTVRNMITVTAGDVHPPLYYLFTQLLYYGFGNSGVVYHLSALLPYAVIMIIGCTFIKKNFGIIPATVTVMMASLMKSAVVYNVEARMYALGAMFILIAYIAFYKIIKNNSLLSWIVFCFSTLCAAYTHYYALISVAFLYIMIIPMAISHKKYRKGLIISLLIAIFGYLPWLTILINSFGTTVSSWWLTDITKIYECFIFLLDYNWVIIFFVILFSLFIVYQLKLLNIKVSNEKKLEDRIDININIPKKFEINEELYWVVCGIISICGTIAVGLILSHMIRPLFIVRYLFLVSTMLYLIIGVCISKMKFRKLWAIIFVIAILLFNVPAYVKKYKTDFDLNNETEKFLKAVRPDNNVELVTNNDDLGWSLLRYYYPNNVSKNDEDAITRLDTNYENIWLIWDEKLDKKDKIIIKKQKYNYKKIYEGTFANGVFYYVYKLQLSK